MSALGGTQPAFSGMEIITVEPGYELKCPRTGEVHIVDDGNAVADGRRVYLTAKHWRSLRDLTAIKEPRNG